MLPKVIIHNSVSLDGSLVSFEVNMPLHYRIAGGFKADMHLVGSETAKAGMELFMKRIPPERAADFKKPDKEGLLWAIPDTTGKLKGRLHVLRQAEYCKDAVILVSQRTPSAYIRYLQERNYDFILIGKDKCDLKLALETLRKNYGAKTILTDTGRVLGNALLDQGLASKISLLVHPVIVGKDSTNMFGCIERRPSLRLITRTLFEKRFLWLVYEVGR